MNTTRILLFFFSLTIFSCGTKAQVFQPNDNSKTSLDWPGTYTGTLPCRDCPGVQTTVQLFSDNRYQLSELNLNQSTRPVISKGKFTWQKDYSRITLQGGNKYQFLVAENQLVRLDSKGQRPSGAQAQAYILKKQQETITEKYWKLISLNGKAIERPKGRKEPYITFKDSSRVGGNGSCNGFGGTYKLSAGNKMKISDVMSTLMACENMSVETQFLNALQQVAYYEVANDVLILKNEKKQQLARFEVVYLK